jgi:hypothetical protein
MENKREKKLPKIKESRKKVAKHLFCSVTII